MTTYRHYGGTPPHNETDTSTAAAVSMREAAVPQRIRVREYIETRGKTGATSEEIAVSLQMRKCSVDPRVRELCISGEVKDSREKRKARSGKPQTVWVAGYAPTISYGPHGKLRAPSIDLAERLRRVDALEGLERKVYQRIKATGEKGICDDRVRRQLGLPFTLSWIHGARIRLVKQGLVDDLGRREKTETGRPAIAWVALQ